MMRKFILLVALIHGASCQPAKKAGGGGSQGAADPRCGELQQSACLDAADCQWTGTQCSGTSAYCGKFSTINSCPAVSCQWSSSGSSCQAFANQTPTTNSCANYTQSNCAMVAGCAWNGVSCVSSGGGSTTSTTGMPGQTTGMPGPNTGLPDPSTGMPGQTTGMPGPTTGGNPPPPGACAALNLWQCFLTQGCQIYLLPSPNCGPKQN
jgi:hypothetical protein